ncbi:hypothetical protein LEP3755_42940 [Leptolyngbya sp. NIES-3755]|nr:hypothetical protein LEP3755_42940 [Leptolyngbya sp. NIES-3755]
MRQKQILATAEKCCFSNSNTESNETQARSLPGTPSDLILDRVPPNLSLAEDRFYISCGNWFAAIQLTRSQAYRAIGLIGRSRDRSKIWWAIEQTIDGGAA